jgi:hypothetical protein
MIAKKSFLPLFFLFSCVPDASGALALQDAEARLRADATIDGGGLDPANGIEILATIDTTPAP